TFDYLANLFPFLRHDSAAPAAYTVHYKVIVPLAVLGALLGLVRRRRGAIVLTGVAVVAAAGFRFVPAGPIWNARLLPFWYLGLYFLAALALGEAAILGNEALGPPPSADEAGLQAPRPNPGPGLAAPAFVFLMAFFYVGGPLKA